MICKLAPLPALLLPAVRLADPLTFTPTETRLMHYTQKVELLPSDTCSYHRDLQPEFFV